MNNVIKRVWNQNKMVAIEDLKGMTFQNESGGHTFQISGIDDDGNTVALTGTPSGVLLRPDNTDVALTCSVSGGVVSATLPANCYDVPGRFGLTIFITSGSSKTAIYAAVGTVTRTSSGTVAPGTSQSVVDLINAINAAVNSIPASYSALLADIAPTYSNSALYSVGQYAWYDGDLKRCIVPITTAESYTAAHWTSAVLGQDVSDLKSALNKYVDIEIATWIDGKAYNTPGSVTSVMPSDMVDVPTFSCASMQVAPGEKVTLTGTGGTGSKLWVWTKADGTILSRSASSITLTDEILIVPDEAAWLLCSVGTALPHRLTKGENVFDYVDEKISDAGAAIESLSDEISDSKTLAEIRIVDNQGNITVKNNIIYSDLLYRLRKIENRSMNQAGFQTTTVFDYVEKAGVTETGNLYEALRVRDVYGNQLAPIYIDFDPDKYKSANMAFGYKADGTHDIRYNANNVVNGELVLSSDTYYIVFQTYTTLDIRFYASVGTYKNQYHVGVNQEFTTFHDCLTALKGNEMPKTIHVYGGTYDILSEMGGTDFISALTGQELWYDVCDIIPPNTHVIGHGNVVFDLTIPSGTPTEKALLLSPINMIGSSTIENVTINCSGGRYCVHAEGSQIEANNNAVWRIVNCKINKTNNLSGVANAIGVGLNNGNYLDIRGCVITNDGNAGLLVHDQQVSAGGFAVSPRVNVENCAIAVQYYPIVMSSTHSGAISGAVLEMTVINCFVNNGYMRKIGSGNADVFHATYVNTPHRIQNGSGLIDIIPDTDYSVFSQS